MDREELIARVSELGLPQGQYCVVGRGPLVVRGLCEGEGIDILVSNDLYSVFKDRTGWEEVPHELSGLTLWNPPYTLLQEFGHGEYWQEPDALIAGADVIDDVAFASLEEIAAMNRATGRPEDHAALALIGEYLYEHPEDDMR